MSYFGGCGIDSCGRSECGNAKSDIEPRFSFSRPSDLSRNNPVDVQLKFDTYCFSSYLDEGDPNFMIEVSEDAGVTFNVAYASGAFVAPYDGVNSKLRHPDGQTLSVWIHKPNVWPIRTKVIIRLTGEDEYGNPVSKTFPVKWS
jgi:hypothetical protein